MPFTDIDARAVPVFVYVRYYTPMYVIDYGDESRTLKFSKKSNQAYPMRWKSKFIS